MITSAPRTAILYARVSVDRDGRSQSVDQQLAALRVVADREGWTVREEIRDDGISASAYSTKARPGYARLADVLQRGDVLAVWELSRATRRMDEFVALRDLCAERGVLLFDGVRLVDLSEPTDAYTTAIGMATSEYESARTRSRIRRSTDARAATGRPASALGFGWEASFDSDTGERVWSLHPTEAPLLADAIADVLRGTTTPYRIAQRWNSEGLTTRKGNAWDASGVKLVLVRPSNAGLRVHRGEIQTVRGSWPSIISEADHARLTHVLTTERVKTAPGRVASTLLSNIALCDECETPLRKDVRPQIKHGQRVGDLVRYRCFDGHVSVRAKQLDDAVTIEVLKLIEGERIAAWLAQGEDDDADVSEHLARAAELEKRLTDAADAYAEGAIAIDALRSITGRLSGQIAEARAAAAAATDDAGLRALIDMDSADRWFGSTLEQQRDFVRAALVVRLGRRGAATITTRRG
jgi:DNA invertase Pin-like site-specific DNA recombinase